MVCLFTLNNSLAFFALPNLSAHSRYAAAVEASMEKRNSISYSGLWRNGERIGLLPRKVRVRIPTDPPNLHVSSNWLGHSADY